MFKLPISLYGHKEIGKQGGVKWLVAQMVVSLPGGKKENVESFLGESGKVARLPEGTQMGVFEADVRESKLSLKLTGVEPLTAAK